MAAESLHSTWAYCWSLQGKVTKMDLHIQFKLLSVPENNRQSWLPSSSFNHYCKSDRIYLAKRLGSCSEPRGPLSRSGMFVYGNRQRGLSRERSSGLKSLEGDTHLFTYLPQWDRACFHYSQIWQPETWCRAKFPWVQEPSSLQGRNISSASKAKGQVEKKTQSVYPYA